ncbi:hypothetical protein [Ferroplasma sp.]|uniref:hypothetical protein n=1 Tax=Ferroplasma sp. TaxID=2591003 RepID=UPI0026330074|nr:hypothetical protein [Ferroplasma sp.]
MNSPCKFADTCEAPFCPLSFHNKGVWLSSDAVCHRKFMDSTILVRNQKLLKKHNVTGYFTLEMLTSSRLTVRNGINPDVDSPNSKNIYRKRERVWLDSIGDKGVKIADLPAQKTLDVYLYQKAKNMHKSAEIEVEK